MVLIDNAHTHTHTHTHTQATVLEEMPPFPERESSLLSKLYQTAPWTAKLHQNESTESTTSTTPPSGFTPGAEEGYTRYMCTTAVSKLAQYIYITLSYYAHGTVLN